LTGGADSDRFIFDSNAAFNPADFGIDRIKDFASGIDKIVLDKTSFTALQSMAGNGFSIASEFASVSSDGAAATSAALIVYNRNNGNLFYNQNGTATGLGTGSRFARFDSSPAIAAADFQLA
jgi:Ca2+-binding RTX toxin-like protein